MRDVIGAIEGEYRRYRGMGHCTIEVLNGGQLCTRVSRNSLSIATIVWHVSGNLRSRFTDFLTSDGEKPWREREDEFSVRTVTQPEVEAKWEEGWDVLMDTLATLNDDDLVKTVKIRNLELTVAEALQRSLAHTSYHVGQIVFLGKMIAGDQWRYLSIPPGGTAAYNADPTLEKA
ncbi:MAG: DUF1572 family protein [Gemmatimonadota bacterium]